MLSFGVLGVPLGFLLLAAIAAAILIVEAYLAIHLFRTRQVDDSATQATPIQADRD